MPAELPPHRTSADDLERRRVQQTLRAKLFGGDVEPVRIERFVVRRRLGAGAMGVVYEAFDPTLSRDVAIKVMLHARLADPNHFLHEARALARLSHPSVLQVYEAGVHEGAPFLVTELVRGGTLGDWLAAGAPRPVAEIARVLVDAGGGLLAAHQRGLVHRDVKPENVLVGIDGRPRIADFGLASVPDPAAAFTAGEPRVAGTLRYMAPEQLRGEGADALSDQFGFSVMAWEALCGHLPFAGRTPEEWLAAITAGAIVDVASGHPASAYLAPLRRGLRAEPAGRYPSMSELLAALRHAAGRSRRRWVAAGVASAVVAGGALVVLAAVRPGAGPGAFKSQAEADAYSRAAAMMLRSDFRGCADALAPFPASASLTRLRADCLFRAHDARGLTAHCAARAKAHGDAPPDPCDAATREAVQHMEQRRYKECVEVLERASDTPSHSIAMAECASKWGTPEAYYRQCVWMKKGAAAAPGECRRVDHR